MLAGVCGQVAAVLLGSSTDSPSSVALGVFSVTLLIAMWVFRRVVTLHLPKDVAWVPLWRALPVGLGSLALSFLVILAVIHLGPFGGTGDAGPGYKDTLFYGPELTEAEGQNVRRALVAVGYLGGDRAGTVLARREGGVLTVGLVVKEGAWDTPEARRYCAEVQRDLVMEGILPPLVVQLLDKEYNVRYRQPASEGTGALPGR